MSISANVNLASRNINTSEPSWNGNEFKICDNNEQLYDLLNEKILDKEIVFEQYEDSLQCTINITKKINVIFKIPEVKITDTNELFKIINSQKNKLIYYQIKLLN